MDAALNIIEELDDEILDLEMKKNDWREIADGRRKLMMEFIKWREQTQTDLRRLHDLIKGAACHEAMELIRRMMG